MALRFCWVGTGLCSYLVSVAWLSASFSTPLHTLLNLIQSLDRSVYYFLSRFHGNWVLDRLAVNMEGTLLLKTAPLLALLWYFWFIDDRDQEERRGKILAILAGAMIGIIVTRTVEAITPFRIRPLYDPHLLQQAFSVPTPSWVERANSFPSDTAAYLVAIGTGVVRLCRRLLVPVVLFLALWICLPRMYLGFHYLSDIIVGTGIGMAALWFSLRDRWLHSKLATRLLGFSRSKPQLFYATAFLVMFELATAFSSTRNIIRILLHLAAVVSTRWS